MSDEKQSGARNALIDEPQVTLNRSGSVSIRFTAHPKTGFVAHVTYEKLARVLEAAADQFFKEGGEK